MPYDPFKHHRRSIRLKDYDYAQAGAYFVTICVRNHEYLFGDVADGEMRLNDCGAIVQSCWDVLPAHYPNVELDAFVVMPNHTHGVVVITDRGAMAAGRVVRARHASPLPHGTPPGSLGAIIGSFKSATTKRINLLRDNAGAPIWQRNYFEHIIRNEKDLERIRAYIDGNPAHWARDEENPAIRAK